MKYLVEEMIVLTQGMISFTVYTPVTGFTIPTHHEHAHPTINQRPITQQKHTQWQVHVWRDATGEDTVSVN